jgi:hypothetical protein
MAEIDGPIEDGDPDFPMTSSRSAESLEPGNGGDTAGILVLCG